MIQEAKKKKKRLHHMRRAARARRLRAEKSKSTSLRIRELVTKALKQELLGPRPGQAKLLIGGSIYFPSQGVYHRVPGRFPSCLIDSPEAVEEVFTAISHLFHLLSEGRWNEERKQLQCPCGRLL
jgi:hypothetical protein